MAEDDKLRSLQIFSSRRLRFALLVLFAPLLLMAAKCIDNETMYQDSGGDWHVVGEIHNETDVWGGGMILQGQLLDMNGNVLATTQAPVCPLELAAHSFDGFDLVFSQSAGLRPSSYKINVKDGHVIDSPLPSSGLSLNGFKARKMSPGINISGSVGTTRNYSRVLTGCVAFYNAAGRVVTHVTVINFGLTLPLLQGTPQSVSFTIPEVQSDATSIRIWLAGDSAEPLASDYASVMTDSITIQ